MNEVALFELNHPEIPVSSTVKESLMVAADTKRIEGRRAAISECAASFEARGMGRFDPERRAAMDEVLRQWRKPGAANG